ncbi:MAG: hypothetical protein WCG80_03140 [Spirochaetales bacterium]
MNTAVTRLYSLLVALTLTGLLAWAVTDWYQLRAKTETQAYEALRDAAGSVTDWSIHTPADSKALSGVIRAKLLGDTRWKMVLLTSPERATEYYYGPRNTGDLSKESPAWAPRFPREILAEVKVYTPSGQPWTLQGVVEFYSTTEVLGLLRASGITLFVLLLLTTLLVAFQLRRRTEPTDSARPAPSPAPSQEEQEAWDPGVPETEDEDEYWFDESLSMEDLPPLNTDTFVSPEGPSLTADSGLGWSHFFADRLGGELDRCAADNQDLTVLLFGGAELASESTYGAVAQEVRAYFPSVDLDFETREKAPGIAVVLPNRSLEKGLSEAQAFLQRVERTLPQVKLRAGVAARTGRLVSAKTLTDEATSALGRAMTGATRVVGLKTDPDRYREHLARQSPEA